MRRANVAKLTAVIAAAALAGCSSAPLPGGEGGDGYQVAIEFADVTDLVPYSTVKVDDVTVGQVEEITVSEKWTAKVKIRVNDDVELPRNAIAALRQTSLLGEKFVELAPPTESKPAGSLSEGDSIPLSRTDKGAEVEEVLGAVALVLQGGGLEQLRTINTELSDMMQGREGEIKDSLGELDTFMTSLDDQREDIVTALEALEKLSGDLADQKETIGEALDAIAPGVTTLAKQKGMITEAITALGELGEVGSDVIEQSGDETVAILQDLQPVLENLVKAGDHFPQGLELAGSYPFPPNVSETIEDDFVNLYITLDGSLENVLGNTLGEKPIKQADPDNPESTPGGTEGGGIDPITGGIDDLLGGGITGDEDEDEEEAP
ncbi:MCE family protein [Stackebrandtia nassauensis]|uniref:Virulence factor Mce family protein n=1 Tax=Stackebrandtia nassauensis (strain DSM 44728 / CIP 108903 / NRRL B-16338 / NBRC 102104 / LLR-40K-21) TaxID=446470 RepID=D3QB65_STANL|nr:MCE family protein [Stackebrandtia nassauensis]ADD40882.1 virulence factor Mce family protein [Stackebrandtia nassauensis DSM 44728]